MGLERAESAHLAPSPPGQPHWGRQPLPPPPAPGTVCPTEGEEGGLAGPDPAQAFPQPPLGPFQLTRVF